MKLCRLLLSDRSSTEDIYVVFFVGSGVALSDSTYLSYCSYSQAPQSGVGQ